MFCFPSILLVEEVEGLPVEGQIRIVDAVWKLPGLGVEVYFLVCGGVGGDVGDEVVLLFCLGVGGHFDA